jgi:hypothetical protein
MRTLWARLRLSSLVIAVCCLTSPLRAQEDTWTGVERIVAVGDVHGDCAQFLKALRAAEVLDGNENWIAGKTHLVQTGDVLDRGADSRKAMDLLMKLEAQASTAGGAVHALVGNHEAMVLLGDWRYVSEGEIKAFGGENEYRQAMSAKGKYGQWIRSHNAAIKINDLLFAHAGITPPLAKMSLAEINKAIRQGLQNGDANGILMDSTGPLWDRILATDDEGLVAKDLDVVLQAFGAGRMVVGHTVSTDGIMTRAGDRLIRIDVGMSGSYGGPAACLVVEKGVFYEARDGKAMRKLAMKAPLTRPVSTEPATSRPATRPSVIGDAHKRGAKVTAVLDKSQETEKYSSATFVANAGIPVSIDDRHRIAHHEIILIDDATTIAGSLNFTKSAGENNAENLLVIEGKPKLMAACRKSFKEHLEHSHEYERKQ